MKRFLMLLIIAITCVSLLASIAEARRFGGGGSFGKQRSAPAQQAQRAPSAAPAPASPSGNRWLGPLAGLAVGAGLMAMFSGGGMGGMMGSLLPALLIAAVVMFLISRFRGSQQTGNAYAAPSSQSPPQTGYAPVSAQPNIPADFPVESFLRNAKASFIRLQAANDRKDINDVREYTTPEIFAEISMQMQERGNTVQNTEVLNLDARLLEVANDGDYVIASVRFNAQLRENAGEIENVDEIWNLQKNMRDDQSVWLLAGIQQVNFQ